MGPSALHGFSGTIFTRWESQCLQYAIVLTSLDTVKTKENAFVDINIEEIVRGAEETLEEETGAGIFGSDDSEDSEDDHHELSEES